MPLQGIFTVKSHNCYNYQILKITSKKLDL
jgi:hypothetical protein